MKFSVITSIFLLACLYSSAAELTFSDQEATPISLKAEVSTGLNTIFVLYSAEGVTASYKSSTSKFNWLRYSNNGGGFAEEIPFTSNGNIHSITLDSNDYGYIIEDGDSRYYCWIVNYANHYAHLDGIAFAEDQDCDRARLRLDGSADKITYYTINGQPKTLSRDLVLRYNTLVYDEASETYLQKLTELKMESIESNFGAVAPLCDTDFILTGDRFLQTWGKGQETRSDTYRAIAVEARSYATEETRDYDNEQKVEADQFGGSGPVEVSFRAVVTDAAIFNEWQISDHPEFENIFDRFRQLDFTYTFREMGNFYVRFVAANSAGTCEYYGDSYHIFVGESDLHCPNAFSPGASEGVNDEWRVSYKSIIEFECHIFNRWGQEICTLTDPGQGWDGTYRGKQVPTGAYYYVIKAVGSDGRKYNLNGDINIIRAKRDDSLQTPGDL